MLPPEPHTNDWLVLIAEAYALALPLIVIAGVILWITWRFLDWWWK